MFIDLLSLVVRAYNNWGGLIEMKRIILLVVLLISTSFILASCSSNSSSKEDDGKVTIKFLHRWPNEPYKTYYNELIKEFEKENPNIKVEQITALNDDYKQKVKVMLGGNNPPDLFFTWVGKSFGDEFIKKDIALDITKYYEENTNWSDNLMVTDPFESDDKFYGVPIYTDSKVFYYNKDMFDKYNLKAPETWEEFIKVLDKLKKNGETPIMFGNKAPWAGGHYITALNQRMVKTETLNNDYTEPEYTDPMYIESLKKFKELVPYFNDDANASDHEQARNFFISGNGGILFAETFESSFIEEAPFKWDTFKMPQISEGEGSQTGIIGAPEGFMVSSKTKHPDETMKLLQFITSKKMGEKLTKDTGMPSAVTGAVNKDTASDKEVELTNMIAESDEILNWLDQGVDTSISKPYMDEIQKMIVGKATPEEVMSKVQSAAKSN